jgi:hypothetical protein
LLGPGMAQPPAARRRKSVARIGRTATRAPRPAKPPQRQTATAPRAAGASLGASSPPGINRRIVPFFEEAIDRGAIVDEDGRSGRTTELLDALDPGHRARERRPLTKGRSATTGSSSIEADLAPVRQDDAGLPSHRVSAVAVWVSGDLGRDRPSPRTWDLPLISAGENGVASRQVRVGGRSSRVTSGNDDALLERARSSCRHPRPPCRCPSRSRRGNQKPPRRHPEEPAVLAQERKDEGVRVRTFRRH